MNDELPFEEDPDQFEQERNNWLEEERYLAEV